MNYKTYKYTYGDMEEQLGYLFKCDTCGKIMEEGWPMYYPEKEFWPQNVEKHYCGECAFRNEFIDGKTLCKDYYYFIDGYDAYLKFCPETGRDEINILPTEKAALKYYARIKNKTQDRRNAPEYKDWRKAVYIRDDYTCQKCGTKGGQLNAHHIKSYIAHKDLRLSLENGVTLCISCHKAEHKKRGRSRNA